MGAPDQAAPDDIRRLAHARRDARIAGDFDEADRLRGLIEAAGWKVVDRGSSYHLERAHPPDVVEAGRTRYGLSGSVPARPIDATVGTASIVLVATDRPDELERCLAGLAAATFDDVQRVVVADAPSPEQETALLAWETGWQRARADATEASISARETEIVWTSERLGAAEALNAGVRRAAGPIVVLLDASTEAIGDLVSPLVGALEDPTVAVAGAWGLASQDLRQFEPAHRGDVAALTVSCLAFRRTDYEARGPLDAHYRSPAHLGTWWSLVLRDEGPQRTPRRAVAIDLPVLLHGPTAEEAAGEPTSRDRDARRNSYRVIRQFGGRFDLAVGRRPPGA